MISVCMATYNGQKYIKEQISSILPQLGSEDELIIFDDASKDDTVSIINSFSSPKIRLHVNKTNFGVVKTFEGALATSKGDYIFLSDQDDIWLPNKVAICLEQLKWTDLVATDCIVVNENLEVLENSFFQMLRARRGVFRNLKKNTYQGCCMCFKSKVLKMILPFPVAIPMHDIWIGFVADLFFRVKFEPSKVLLYRRHESTATNTDVGKSRVGFLKKISYRLNLIKYIPLLLIRYLRKVFR